MLIAKIKNYFSRGGKRKRRGYASFSSDLHVRGAAAEMDNFKPRRNRLTKLRQRLQAKKQESREEYSRPKSKGRMYIRFAFLLLVVIAVPLLWSYGGGKKIIQELQAIAIFKVEKIEIIGCSAVAKEKIVDASGIILHQTSLLSLHTSLIEANISAIPWVSKAAVTRRWPAKIEISIEESAPVALLHAPHVEGNQLQYLDANGIAFSAVSPGADIDFPIVTGLTEITDQQIKDKALSEILTFLRKVQGNDPHLPVQSVSELHITKSGEMVVYLVEYPFPIFFGNGNTKQKYSRLIQVLRALYKKQNGKELLSQIEYIQMDYLNDKVLVVESGSG
jgi:cell division protein FtsQ